CISGSHCAGEGVLWYGKSKGKQANNRKGATDMKRIFGARIALTILALFLSSLQAANGSQAATDHDFRFFVSSTIGLVPGQTGFLKTAILNTGSVPVKFQRWNPTLSTGGFGWDFNHPGLALGFFDFTLFGSDFQHFSKAEGHVDPIVPKGPFG